MTSSGALAGPGNVMFGTTAGTVASADTMGVVEVPGLAPGVVAS